jgi:hypothetical protein
MAANCTISGSRILAYLVKDNVLKNYVDVFQGLGTLTGEYKILLEDDVTTSVCPQDESRSLYKMLLEVSWRDC